MSIDTATLLKQFDPIIDMFTVLSQKTKYKDFSDIPLPESQQFVTLSLACIDRVAGSDSVYAQQAKIASSRYANRFWHEAIPEVYGIVQSLRTDVSNGFLTTMNFPRGKPRSIAESAA